MSKIVVFGAGFLGQRMAREIPGAVLSRADITDKAAVVAALRETGAEAVINAAGKTGRPNVDWCESHQVETFRGNVTGALTLAEACAEAGVYLLHLASGCIFYGPSPTPGGWLKDNRANPSAFYSRTKYAADLVLSRLPNVGVARLRMPIDEAPGVRNLITKLSRYPEVIDVENSVTIVSESDPGGGAARRQAPGPASSTSSTPARCATAICWPCTAESSTPRTATPSSAKKSWSPAASRSARGPTASSRARASPRWASPSAPSRPRCATR